MIQPYLISEAEQLIGSTVKAYDFDIRPGKTDDQRSFVIGQCTDVIEHADGTYRYVIEVDFESFHGTIEAKYNDDKTVYPPVNGTKNQFGRVIDRVLLYEIQFPYWKLEAGFKL